MYYFCVSNSSSISVENEADLLEKYFEILNKMEVKVKKPKIAVKNRNGALSFRQIRNRVGDGWAIIQDPEFNGCILLGGKLLYHSSDRKKALDEFGKCENGHFAFKYCGKPDPNAVYLL